MCSKFFKFLPYYHIFVSVGTLKYTTTVDLSLVFFRSLKKEIMGSSFLKEETLFKEYYNRNVDYFRPDLVVDPGGGGVLPYYMGYIGMCRSEGYGFQVVYSRIGYINQSVWV